MIIEFVNFLNMFGLLFRYFFNGYSLINLLYLCITTINHPFIFSYDLVLILAFTEITIIHIRNNIKLSSCEEFLT